MNPSSSRPELAVLRTLASSINAFSFRLFRETARNEGQVNVFLSPFSVFSALAMLYGGAAAATARAMADSLGLPEADAQAVGESYAALWDDLQRPETKSELEKQFLRRLGREAEEEAPPACQLDIANSLWVARQIALDPAFLELAGTRYHGEARPVDFRSPRTPGRINDWVKEKTRGKIASIVDQIDPLTVLILLNAVYFKGKWQFPFPEERTKDGDFFLPGGRKKRLPMMHMDQAHELPHFRSRELEAVSLPYGKGRMSMYIFLPSGNAPLEAFYSSLTEENWQQWMHQLRPSKGRVVLPRFRVEYSAVLNEPLQQLGMGPAFSPHTADFRKLSGGNKPVHISEIRHKTFLEVTEEGTEAAAVPRHPPPTLHHDRRPALLLRHPR